MIPLRDDVRAERTPIVNYLLIGICALVFLMQLAQDRDGLVENFAMIPARVMDPDTPVTLTEQIPVIRSGRVEIEERRREIPPAVVPAWLTLLTCTFLHGGWMHLIGNLWFLFIFGDNVEDRLGRWRYLGFYLLCGLAASLTHLLTAPDSPVPTVGASGAIAGVMGAYLLLYPKARVLTLVPLIVIFDIIVVPASLFLGVWFALQLFQGTLALGHTRAAGVAWWAHIGGFAAGWLIILALRKHGLLRPTPVRRRLPEGRVAVRPFQRRRRPF